MPTVKQVTGIVDFAHTPDGLDKILSDLNEMKTPNTRIIAVVGCGGDKDKEKRRLIGKIGYKKSDLLILTSDNPGLEDPLVIIRDMVEGIPRRSNKRVVMITDREAAIQRACEIAAPGDTILVAGKGHERFQLIGNQRVPFSDQEVLQRNLWR
jgi:UDP-N-acetylmuramoyl-L-alanyl-D-glutamate--2,6-diaminopimelate ligase